MSGRSAIPPHLSALAELITERIGLDLRRGGSSATIAALEAAGWGTGSERGIPDWLLDRVTVGETHFFREPHQMEFIRRRVLPEIARRHGGDRRIRIWSAGCATGEEAYTLAIVAEEAGLAARTDILATDISRSALERAAEGVYGEWSLRGVEDETRRRYFRQDGERFRIDGRFRERITFRRLNLVGDPYPPPVDLGRGLDLVLCRNVLIYLTAGAAALVVRRLVGSLAPGGWLITSSSDPYLGSESELETVTGPNVVVYRRLAATPDPRGKTGRTGLVERRVDAPRSPAQRVPVRHAATPPPAVDDAPPSLDDIRALAESGRVDAALDAAAEACDANSLDAGLHYVRALLLTEVGRWSDAAQAAVAATYLDPGLVVGHIVLGRAELGRGNRPAADRAFRNARRLLDELAEDEPVLLADGAVAGHLRMDLEHVDLARGRR